MRSDQETGFKGHHQQTGRSIELRLAQNLSGSALSFLHWKGILFGEGDWHQKTEDRIECPLLNVGDTLHFEQGLTAQIVSISEYNQRLIELRFMSKEESILRDIYRSGRLIQSSYHEAELDLWDGQTIFSGPPIALEAPSAAFPMTWEIVKNLLEQGVKVAPIYHSAGISSTGEPTLDALLPFPEHYRIPTETARLINHAKREGNRIIALGTSVTRALESAATTNVTSNAEQPISAGSGVTDLIITPDYKRKVVDGLITGMHENGSSHLKLLQSFAPMNLIRNAYEDAQRKDYLWHEYGDSCLIV